MIGNAVALLGLGGPTAYLCAAVVAHELREHRHRTIAAEPLSPARRPPLTAHQAA
ncbi:hypothetical protein [Nocardia fluminea]|uniref:Uncharacterized protein n=1 Tax=Nocardia fluminea TaxID=134984 RepID=A0A2N3V4R3_9NOCA|nr:hypothetical protein [Nocardia fluminea]PKV76556.1 hypothetical protein ATK86_7488 [Nocardia fluminea]